MTALRDKGSLATRYQELLYLKEKALAGYIVYVAICTGNGPTVETMRLLFGAWVWRRPEIVQEDDGWVLRA